MWTYEPDGTAEKVVGTIVYRAVPTFAGWQAVRKVDGLTTLIAGPFRHASEAQVACDEFERRRIR